ncbi:hypothetical protein SAY87_006436 [Trapa incisa]|uniref:Thioredoxin domain-containing protein n=1 Tax=Trapa incisa TaxID=236973 RepID=A0AAN7JZG0_9MYRT|nr:hypothetical protein SAY87_006436 [Trapa incisa]
MRLIGVCKDLWFQTSMAASLKIGFCVPVIYEAAGFGSRSRGIPKLYFCSVGSSSSRTGHPQLTSELVGDRSISSHASGCVGRAMRWWKSGLRPNMAEINSAPELVSTLLRAGDCLVVVEFYSPSCGGCRTLHPKITQLAESNPNAIFLKVNYDELGAMCDCLNVRVLPFFRFYRGAEGQVCSFSCTTATIKKLKDALTKYGIQRCSNCPAKGLEDAELMRLASCGEIPVGFPSTGKENRSRETATSQSNLRDDH